MNFRPELAKRLAQCLDAFQDGFRHNVALIGPPGAGKTFQIEAALRAPRPLVTMACPLYRESCRSFLTRFVGAITAAGLRPDAAPVQHVHNLISRRQHAEAFTKALDLIPLLAAEQRQPVVLALDEFLYLEELGLAHAFHELGKRVMTWPHTLFILSSSSPFRAKAILRERLQLLFGHFEILTLDTPEPGATQRWVRHQLAGLEGAQDGVAFLLHWLGGSPWYLTAFIQRLRELATLRDTRQLNEPLFFETAWDLLGHPSGSLHQWCGARVGAVGHGRTGAKATEALIAIADGARTLTEIARRIGRAGLTTALQTLTSHDLVQRQGACWFVPDPVCRSWLTTVLSPQRQGMGNDPATCRARFERHLSGAWMHWLHTVELSSSEQIVHLLSRFQDDTISLDSKTGRLPRFDRIHAQPDLQGPAAAATYLVADGLGSKRWCCAVHEARIDEAAVARFENFCRSQAPKPSRKIIVARGPVDDNARLLAKAHHMWVWQPEELRVLMELYGQLPESAHAVAAIRA